jgi:signal transduction histidine kinase/ActR/RegA family two-component response regulator
LDPPLRDLLSDQQILSLALMPVHSGGAFVGFIGFDDCQSERVWEDDEIESLRAAAAGLGGAISRDRMELSISGRAEELKRSRKVALSLMEDAQRAVATAEQANNAKSAFLAMMSHEIRTPLNGVIGFTDLLLDEELPPHQAELVSTIRNCGNTLLSLISDILDLSKIESGRFDLEMIPFSLRHCLEDVLGSFEPALREKNLAVSSVVEESVPEEIVSDPKRLRQIFFNLIGNAVKFTSQGGIAIRVRASSPPGGRLIMACEITDTGIGIPEAEQQRIFEAFGQADTSIHRRFGGSGLGLAICRKIVDALGGTISLRSVPGEGTTFEFTIPAYRNTQASARSVTPAPRPPVQPASGLRVLVADDVPANLLLLKGILKKMGCTPDLAADGLEAASLAEKNDFDIIFMDVLMPVCDGLESTRMIREFERKAPARKRAYIAALTADAFADNRTRCLEAGMDEFLTKPLRMETIRVAIEHAVRGAEEG